MMTLSRLAPSRSIRLSGTQRWQAVALASGCRRQSTDAETHIRKLHEENEKLRLENERLQRRASAVVPSGQDREMSKFAGARSVYTTDPHFYYPHVDTPPPSMPCFRLMDDLGSIIPGAEPNVPEITREQALAMMVLSLIHI